ncbi:AAA family ATPase [Pseudanabaena sp. ABRG5-3]|uniref:AAA family ATPase n=1 Tax=Pseudanabaena sp. ABRG5-3 TaxID=685565 RepID=UPI000DC6E835|nr:AAA family ATPase [Pseudanabaena sp. ABRG5-3]BBC24251.1 ATP-binding protein [Pseudanabaena sp. ABRG5-3]
MKINWLSIKDFRGFRDCGITFPKNSNIVVFIGINGAGKSAILEAISILLNVLVKDICSQKRTSPLSYKELSSDDINLKAKSYRLDMIFSSQVKNHQVFRNKDLGDKYNITLVYKQNRIDGTYRDFVKNIKSSILESELELLDLPIFIYYSINRNVVDNTKNGKPKQINKYQEPQYLAYENAFSSHVNSFNEFVQWFKMEEDFEHQLQIDYKDFDYRNRRLEVIRYAINKFLNVFDFAKFSDLKIERERTINYPISLSQESIISSLTIDKDGQRFKFSQLSSGEKMMLSLVVDVARRLAIANPSLDNKLEGEGIVLIDEIDLHLHPQWQRKLLPALTHTFPNIQFIVTTHSPQVLSHLPRESVFLLEDNKISDREIYTEGRDSNSILLDAFHVPEVDKEYEVEIKEIYDLISNYDAENAQQKLEKLKEKRGEYDREIMRMQSYIDIL